MSTKPLVIILHGIFRTSWSMKLYEFYLRMQGYDTINLTYPSLRFSLDELSAIVGKRLAMSEKVMNARQIHFVTHSMGGLITRYVLDTHQELRIKTANIVMLVPPNGGSELADYAKETGWAKPIYALFGPAGKQLTSEYSVNYPAISGNIGIIAGAKSSNPFARLVFAAEQKHDGTISHDKMKLPNLDRLEEVPASHTSILCSPTAIRKTAFFLKTGSFEQPELPAAP